MGEHPEWHSYEITNDDESYRVMQRFYELGGSRINFHGNINIYVDGNPQSNVIVVKDINRCNHPQINKVHATNK